MSDQARIAEILRTRFKYSVRKLVVGSEWIDTGPEAVKVEDLAAEIDAALHPRIDTVEELDALPTLAIVRDEWTSAAGWQHSGVWERRGMSWHCIAAPVLPPGHPRPNLPARVLWTPEAHDG